MSRSALTGAALALALSAGAALAAPAAAGDRALIAAHRGLYPAAEAAAARASGPDGVQRAYDVTRDLQEAVRRSAPVSAGCRGLLVGLARYAAGRILQYEGVDRPSAADSARGRRRAEAARASVPSTAAGCRGSGGGTARPALWISPSDGEVFYGAIVARAPRGADRAELVVRGRSVLRVRVSGGRARFAVTGNPGRYDLRVLFARAGAPAGALSARGAWFLGPAARRAAPGSRTGAALANALARAAAGGPRYRAAWVQSLVTGEAAGLNAAAAFPAASTVKLGLMVAALGRLGARPEDSAYAYDLRAMASWSSNLATNRVLRRLGGAATAADGLRRLGATASTFTGEYIVGTELQPALPAGGAFSAPPRVSGRVTTARDLARMLYGIQAAAVGAPGARAQTGLSTHQARLLLGWLLSSQQRGDNQSLVAGGAPGVPIAQKNGWISRARLGAGLIFTARGPVIAVLATYDDAGVGLGEAQALGARIAQVATGG